MHTIVATATPPSPAVRGAVRLSGPDVASILAAAGLAVPKRTGRTSIQIATDSPIGSVPADLLYWAGDRSYTGAPSAEIHTIGSPPVLDAIMARLVTAGAVPAAPGEFTLRAFLAGRIDLPQAEAVLGVIDAPGDAAFEASLSQLAGNVSRPLSIIRADLITLLADIEAALDFVDEDIEFVTTESILRRLQAAKQVVASAQNGLSSRTASTARPVVTLRGLPNAGKSRLINALAGRDAAIVSPTAGTTRDVVQTPARVGGIELTLCDTAGIEPDNAHRFATAAETRSADQDALADVRLWCVDASSSDFDSDANQLTDRTETLTAVRRTGVRDIWVATKIDIAPSTAPNETTTRRWIRCSSVTGEGLTTLQNAIVAALETTGDATGTAARCDASLTAADRALSAAIASAQGQMGQELVAAEIRESLVAIGEVTGEIYTDDILDKVFSRFCIGK